MSNRSLVNIDHAQYAETLESDVRVAYMSVLLFLIAVARHVVKTGRVHYIDTGDMHKFYPHFGKRIDVHISFLEVSDGKCRAVSIFCRQELLTGIDYDHKPVLLKVLLDRYSDLVDTHPDKKLVLEAAKEVCEKLFPSWEWNQSTALN